MAAAVLALATIGFLLSPAWGAIKPGNSTGSGTSEVEGPGGGEAGGPTTTEQVAGSTSETTGGSTTTDPAPAETSTTDTTAATSTTDTTAATSTTDTTAGTSTTETTETTPPPVELEVPNVAGLTLDSAREQLLGEGFTDIDDVEEPSSTVAAGLVIRTDPAAGLTATPSETITIVVSSGPEVVSMPNVIGRERDEAIAIVESLGLDVTVETVVVPLGSPDVGKVIDTDPVAGTDVAVGSSVTLQVGRIELPPITIDPIIVPPTINTTTTLGLTSP